MRIALKSTKTMHIAARGGLTDNPINKNKTYSIVDKETQKNTIHIVTNGGLADKIFKYSNKPCIQYQNQKNKCI